MDELELLALAAAAAKKKAGGAPRTPQPPEGTVIDPLTGQMVDPNLMQNHISVNPAMAAAHGAGQGVSLGSMDETVGAMYGAAGPSDDYGQNRDYALAKMRAEESANRDAHPWITGGAEFGGAILSALLLERLGGKGISKFKKNPVPLSARSLPARAAAAAGVGAAEGGAYAFNTGEGSASDRVERVPLGAAAGGAVGLASPFVGDIAGRGYRGVKEHIRNANIHKATGLNLGVSPKTSRIVADTLQTQDPMRMDEAMRHMGPDAMLADSGPSARQTLDVITQMPGEGPRTAMTRIDNRAMKIGQETDQTLNSVLGAPEGVETAKEAIQAGTQQARRTAYDAAYGHGIDWRSPAGEKLRHLIETTPDDVLRSAAKTRNMRPTPLQRGTQYADDFAPTTTTTNGPESFAAKEAQEVDDFFRAYSEIPRDTSQRRPLTETIKAMGGVDPDSPAGRELKAMGITSRNSPALFRKGGLHDLDNLDPSMFPDSIQGRGDGTGNYMDRQALLDGIVDEWNGNPTTSYSDGLDQAYVNEMEELHPVYEARRQSIAAADAATPNAPPKVGDLVPTRTVEDIDMIKRELDTIARGEGSGPFVTDTPHSMAAADRARQVRDSLSEAAPPYKTALQLGADPIRRRQAVDAGRDMLKTDTTREMVQRTLTDMTDGEKSAVRQGLRSQIDDVLARVKAVPSDQNVDIRETASLFKMLSNRDSREKMQMLLSDAEYNQVIKQLDRAGIALGLRADVGGNSKTAGRKFFENLLDESVDPGPVGKGEVIGGAKRAYQHVSGASPARVASMKADIRNEVADLMTRGDGNALRMLFEQALSRNTLPANIEQMPRAVGSAVTKGAIPSAVNLLSTLLQGR